MVRRHQSDGRSMAHCHDVLFWLPAPFSATGVQTKITPTTIFICVARIWIVMACTDRHRCGQSNNSGKEGETHFLYEVIWNILRGISNDISEDGKI